MQLPALSLVLLALLSPALRAEEPSSPIREGLESFVKDGSLAGAVAVFQHDGKTVTEVVGYRDLASQEPMKADSLFWIASMTKPVTAMAVLMLQEEGKLKVEDPISDYLPEFKNQMLVKEKDDEQVVLVKPSRPVTVRDLLTHTSGLVGNSPLDADALDVLSLKEAVITYALSPLQFEPGTKWSYCNPGINTLGRLVEVASGEEYAAFLQRRIFDPLGMKDTTFWPTEAQLARLATSYKPGPDGKGLEPTTIRYLTEPFSNQKRAPLAAGGLFSTADDLLKLYTMLLNGGEAGGKRYLSRETLALMTTDHTGDLKSGFTDGMGMGLGFQVVREPTGVTAMLSRGTYGHGGAHGTQGWIDPVKKTIHILLIQRAGLSNGDASPMRQAFQEAAASMLEKP
ncbi:MAG: beta-lactamase family protein [Verrucomicrobiae bacterium]|nr:beta-lactamase family protein [Verrucomicrobiae bacterium]